MEQVTGPQTDFTVAADPHVQTLVAENTHLRMENEKLRLINERFARKLGTLRDGIAVLAERIKAEVADGGNE